MQSKRNRAAAQQNTGWGRKDEKEGGTHILLSVLGRPPREQTRVSAHLDSILIAKLWDANPLFGVDEEWIGRRQECLRRVERVGYG